MFTAVQLLEDIALQFAESSFTAGGEYLRDRHAGFLDDEFIHIHKTETQLGCQAAPQGGLSAAHESDEHYIQTRWRDGDRRDHAAFWQGGHGRWRLC